eukprot:CAMPEP_0179688702 /NCGR_PEP_ID=MMETSP0936-20121108/2808_1 /TAXON_ID=548131 ORGANISM="Ostreococcus mediterraneus, Strain clade-D-RCC2573" /NCGR_SAMPLE_ID=MMETSP0936 /ASSEMBLY_ACC=CAM_ASM_000574 /LENGTH=59 /DNA_ID=CAMNT_0021561269 /DNA_START=917 /DNA_END=1096 /DNA_ORIENTATION=-
MNTYTWLFGSEFKYDPSNARRGLPTRLATLSPSNITVVVAAPNTTASNAPVNMTPRRAL